MHAALESRHRTARETRNPKSLSLFSARQRAAVVDALLISAIVIAPVAGGSSHLWMLPVLALLASFAYAGTISLAGSRGFRLQLTGLPVALVALAVICGLQLIPLPEWLLGFLSPHALETRTFVGDGLSARPITYEPAATAREAAKLLICAMIAFVAFERARKHRRLGAVTGAVVVAALASAVVAVVHRVAGADRMLGILPSHKQPDMLITTFVNQNHAAGFMVFAALSALGMALGSKQLSRKVGFTAASMLLVVVSVLSYSRGGLLALAVGIGLLLALLAHREELREAAGGFRGAGLIGAIAVVIVSGSAAVAWRLDAVTREFRGTEQDPLGIAAKLGAMKDAWPMIFDHPWLGIGRGSYISVYTAYKTYPLQYTFTHPENLIAQLASDWGPVIGGAALIGLVGALILRLLRSESPVALGALAGVVALVTQNLFDFSLEILGVAIPVAAVLGATAAEVVRSRRVPLSHPWAAGLAVGAPIFALMAATAGAFALGDLETDLATLKGEVQSRLSKRGNVEPAKDAIERLRPIAARHPANSVITAQMAYLAEIAQPPDLPEAIRWANRTMALAPTYAGGHLSTGRILIRAGYRKQGFAEMRSAWTAMSASPRVVEYVQEVIRWARSSEEIAMAIPRTSLDRIDEVELIRASFYLRQAGKADWARELMRRHADPARAEPQQVLPLAIECAALKESELARRFLARRRADAPHDEQAARLLIELELAAGQLDDAERELDVLLNEPGINHLPFARLKVDLALRRGDIDLARATLEQMRNSSSPTQANQIMLSRVEAMIETMGEHPSRAVEALSHALRLAPSNGALRVERARLLLRLNRKREARADLEIAVRAEPDNAEAQALLATVSQQLEPPPQAEEDK